MKKLIVFLFVMLLPSSVIAGAEEDRNDIREMRQKILTRLYKEEPRAKKKIEKAVGYATFSNIGVNIIFLSAGNGSGIVKNNETGKETYMQMVSAGVGIGLGVKDFSAVFIFYTEEALENFVEHGWDFSGQADAAAKSGKKGGETSKAATIVEGVEVYQMTENGLALQATLQGTKYWKDGDLN
ncbi:YSC84-related protein [Thalassotalea atypica]|uniref:lipid-binding SYLF domain-containing protein n=1 Tax=Thalassotalea atypica TaxID=2054316 RepID=UPI002572AEE2|nr:YSC84-related protein [Thalassotalea atypica]